MVFRRVARSTDKTTLICTIIPKNTVTVETLQILELYHTNKQGRVVPSITNKEQLFLTGLLNSFINNFIIRKKISSTLNIFYIYQLPIPKLKEGEWFFDQIVPRVARLICITNNYSDFWCEVFHKDWNKIDKNDGGTSQLQDWNTLEKEWNAHCGVNGWDNTKHDIGDRAQLRCEIDALVAHLYGLDKSELEYILSTFPGVKRNTPWLIEGTLCEYERMKEYIPE